MSKKEEPLGSKPTIQKGLRMVVVRNNFIINPIGEHFRFASLAIDVAFTLSIALKLA